VYQFLTPFVSTIEYVAPANATLAGILSTACAGETHWAALGSFSHTSGLGYNWCDADEGSDASQMVSGSQMLWAARAGEPGAAFFARHIVLSALPQSLARSAALTDDARQGPSNFVLFYEPAGTLADYEATPRALGFLTKQLLAVRGGAAFGAGPADTFFGAKGLDGQDQRSHGESACQPVDHNDLDAGSFVWDAAGQRFAQDLGYDNYGLLGYFSLPTRYQYYRTSTFGHNTIMYDGVMQPPCTFANFTSFNSTSGLAIGTGGVCGEARLAASPAAGAGGITAETWAVLDLTGVYNASTALGGFRRGFLALNARAAFATVDEFPPSLPTVNVTWTLHINGTAAVAPGGQSVRLVAAPGNGTAQLVVNSAATDAACMAAGAFVAAPLVLAPVPGGPGRQQFNTTGIVRVQYVISFAAGSPARAGCGRLAVVMAADGGEGAVPPPFPVSPMSAWPGSGPFPPLA